MALKLDVYAIVGESNAGKSTMVKHLTSQSESIESGSRDGRKHGFFEILLQNDTTLDIWTRRMALQEAVLSPERAVAYISSKFESPKRPSNCNTILIALRDRQHSGLADGDKYLKYFSKQGWSIKSLVLMHSVTGVKRYEDLGVTPLTLDSEFDAPDKDLSPHSISDRVGRIRDHFGWK